MCATFELPSCKKKGQLSLTIPKWYMVPNAFSIWMVISSQFPITILTWSQMPLAIVWSQTPINHWCVQHNLLVLPMGKSQPTKKKTIHNWIELSSCVIPLYITEEIQFYSKWILTKDGKKNFASSCYNLLNNAIISHTHKKKKPFSHCWKLRKK